MVYGNKFSSFDTYEFKDADLTGMNEGVIDDIKKNVTNLVDLFKEWKGVADKFTKHRWIFRYIKDDKQEAMLHKHFDVLCDENVSYGQYKRSFAFICQFMGLSKNDTILETISFTNDKKDKNQKIIKVMYSRGFQKVKIPSDVKLIHVSPVDNITELKPAFRSKAKGRYLYPNNRCFFTVFKPIDSNKASLEGKKLTKYVTKNEYTEAYIDPTYFEFINGSVYIPTEKPIPVVKVIDKFKEFFDKLQKKKDTKELNKEENKEEDIKEGFEDIINSAIKDKLDKGEVFNADDLDKWDEESKKKDEEVKESTEIIQEVSLPEFLDMIKKWKTANQNHSRQVFKSDNITDEEYQELSQIFEDLKETENYSKYYKAFKALCKYAHIAPDGTIITKHELKKGKNKDENSLFVEYSYNNKKIKLPDGLGLFHMSKVGGIKELIPTFRGKSEKGYLYDKPRIYFTINKYMPRIAADYGANTKLHKYRSKEDIKDVYVDPLVWTQAAGAVYVQTNKPVPVEDISKDNIVSDTGKAIVDTAKDVGNTIADTAKNTVNDIVNHNENDKEVKESTIENDFDIFNF